ncbi:hypothetical protein RND81_06G120500 [Saponaria officinalis]|uniref:Bulb-type lectin domain-containing protein n=1 Tax=Saponaria officinalis TaxID=3572 RepID=A0AAW1KAS0_SAPOF
MSISSIKSTVEWVGKLALEEVKYLRKVRDNVEDLKSELEWMQCLLLDADVKQNNDALIRKWMSEISDISLEAEEIIETYILKVSNKRGFVIEIVDELLWLTCSSITLHKVGPQIDCITSKMSKLTSRLQTYGVKGPYDSPSSNRDKVTTMLAEQRRTYSHDEANYVVGIEAHVLGLITQLQAPQKIVVVHGMGGIGKTTLARQLFSHRRSKECFAGVAWAYVSQQVNLNTICRDILYQLTPDERNTIRELSNSELPGKLCEVLKNKKYLVVLDDVWTVGDWERLAPAFPVRDTSFQSKLLITTRNPQILSHLGDKVVSTWEAKTLDKKNDWELLEKKGSFTQDSLDPVMKEVGRKMLDRCDGNPLAIVALGGVLATKKSLHEWESVLDNLQSHLQGDGLYSRVYDVLAMGYYDLHYNIKPCFLHMSHFPEDFRISVDRIYSLWIAEGIVSPIQERIGSKRALEDIAENYLNQLVQKGMIRVVDIDAYDKINTCSLHDLMRDKCLDIAREENFVKIVDLEHQNDSGIGDSDSKKVRRLTMHVGTEAADESVLKASSGNVSSLRSLLFISTCGEEDRIEVASEWIKDICKKFELLRVLDFEGVVLGGSLPTEVGNLIYLRYLSLKGTHVTELPSSICNLRSLLILDLRVKKVRIKLPNVFTNLTSLRHLYFPTRVLSQEAHAARPQGYEIEDGNSLNLDNLSHLERVDDVDLDRVDESCLSKLSSIRKLSASCKSQSRGWDGLVSVVKSSSIKHLSLKVDAGLLFEESSMVLSNSESLRILHIDVEREPPCYLPIRAEMFPRNLVELGFWYCIIQEDPMPILEQLTNLKILQFRICYNGSKMKCSATGFPGVTYLALDGLGSLKDWTVDKGGFPKLQEIGIYNCPLQAFPDTLPPNISFSCTPDLQEKVNEFRQRVEVSKDQPGSSTGGQINVAGKPSRSPGLKVFRFVAQLKCESRGCRLFRSAAQTMAPKRLLTTPPWLCLAAIYTFLLIFWFNFRFSSAELNSITFPRILKDPETLVSSNANFKLGFFSPIESTNRYLGIWYNNRNSSGNSLAIIWVANRDSPVKDLSAVLRISDDGNLQVTDEQN